MYTKYCILKFHWKILYNEYSILKSHWKLLYTTIFPASVNEKSNAQTNNGRRTWIPYKNVGTFESRAFTIQNQNRYSIQEWS